MPTQQDEDEKLGWLMSAGLVTTAVLVIAAFLWGMSELVERAHHVGG
jgi:hypothetical protein